MGDSGDAVSRAGSRETSLLFFGCFLLILFACLCGVYVVHAYWNRQARHLLEERRLEEERNNPWAIRERYERGVSSREGSAKEGSVFGGSIVRGFMYGLYVLNPSGSFSFGSSRVETNEKEVKARREAKARATAVVGATAANAATISSPPVRSLGARAPNEETPDDGHSSSAFDVEAGIVAPAETARDLASSRAPSGDTSGDTSVPDPWAPETRGPAPVAATEGGDSSDRRVDRHSGEALLRLSAS